MLYAHEYLKLSFLHYTQNAFLQRKIIIRKVKLISSIAGYTWRESDEPPVKGPGGWKPKDTFLIYSLGEVRREKYYKLLQITAFLRRAQAAIYYRILELEENRKVHIILFKGEKRCLLAFLSPSSNILVLYYISSIFKFPFGGKRLKLTGKWRAYLSCKRYILKAKIPSVYEYVMRIPALCFSFYTLHILHKNLNF